MELVEGMVARIVEELLFKLNFLHEMVNSAEWRHYSRKSFIHALNNSIEKLEGILESLKALKERLEEEPSVDAPDAEPLIQEFHKTINILRKNLAFEEELFEKRKEGLDLKDKVEVPELYASLSQRILALLLRTRFFLERIHLFTSTEKITPLEEKSTAKNILQLLRTKEKEYQELKEKYEVLRSQSFEVKLEGTSSSDLEKEMNEVARKLETENQFLLKEFSSFRKQIDSLNENYSALKERIHSSNDLAYHFLDKSIELVTTLKKERDFAKKMVLEIEHETLKLRGAYSKELLNLQESKLKVKEEAEKEVREKMSKLEEELKEKNSLLEEFKKMVSEKNKKIEELEKELHLKKAKETARGTSGERTGKKKDK